MPRRLAQQRITLSDLEWPFQVRHYRLFGRGVHCERNANLIALCTSSTLKSTSASRAVSALAELVLLATT